MLKMLYYFFYLSSLFDLIFDALQTETDFLEAPENDALRVRVEHRQRLLAALVISLRELRQVLTEIYLDVWAGVFENVVVGFAGFRGGELRVGGGVAALLLDFFEEFVGEVDFVGGSGVVVVVIRGVRI